MLIWHDGRSKPAFLLCVLKSWLSKSPPSTKKDAFDIYKVISTKVCIKKAPTFCKVLVCEEILKYTKTSEIERMIQMKANKVLLWLKKYSIYGLQLAGIKEFKESKNTSRFFVVSHRKQYGILYSSFENLVYEFFHTLWHQKNTLKN